jgi:hypothetical protein
LYWVLLLFRLYGTFKLWNSFFFFFGRIRVWTQGFALCRVGAVLLEPYLHFIFFFLPWLFWRWMSYLFWWYWNAVLPISPSQIPRITGVSHWHLTILWDSFQQHYLDYFYVHVLKDLSRLYWLVLKYWSIMGEYTGLSC